MPLVSYGDKELCRDRGRALHHIYPWLNYRPPLGNTAAINTPADRMLVKAEDIFWRVVQDLCHPKWFPPISFFAYPHKANPLCHLPCNICTWELYHLRVLWWCSAVQWCSEETKRSKLIKQITPWHWATGICSTWRISDKWKTLAGARLQSFQRLLAPFQRENDSWNILHRGFLLIHIKLLDRVSLNCWFSSYSIQRAEQYVVLNFAMNRIQSTTSIML